MILLHADKTGENTYNAWLKIEFSDKWWTMDYREDVVDDPEKHGKTKPEEPQQAL
jgi:hypothetical protein